MAGICTATVSPDACGHSTVTVLLDGQIVTLALHEDDLLPLTVEERELLVRLGLRRLKSLTGVTLAQVLNRVVQGDEATNVKQYDLLAAGAAVTKTNIGTAYVDVLPGANGQRSLVDFTGCTQYRIVANVNIVGTGQFGMRVVRDSDSAVLHENANIGAAGERELDTDWQTLPAQASGLLLVRLQAKSTAAADDPIFRRCILLAR